MTTEFAFEPDLLAKARRYGKHASDEETVAAALEEYIKQLIQRNDQLRILELAGTIEYDDDYDYKAARSGRKRL